MKVANIRYIQIHNDGLLYIQFDGKKLYEVDFQIENGYLIINKGKHIIKGKFVKETKSGIILADWTIENERFKEDRETSEYEDLARIDYYSEIAKKKKLTKEELIFNIDRVLDKYRTNPETQNKNETFIAIPTEDMWKVIDELLKGHKV